MLRRSTLRSTRMNAIKQCASDPACIRPPTLPNVYSVASLINKRPRFVILKIFFTKISLENNSRHKRTAFVQRKIQVPKTIVGSISQGFKGLKRFTLINGRYLIIYSARHFSWLKIKLLYIGVGL